MARELRLRKGRLDGVPVKGAPYPPVPPRRKRDRQPRPLHPVKRTTRPQPLREVSSPADVAKAGGDDPRGNPDPVVFHEYSRPGSLTKNLTNAADMSGADSEPDVVMMSGNWYADVSKNGGGSWKRLDPTTIFPESLGGGFCCDQIVVYVPGVDRFVWFLQYRADAAGQGAFRIASASAQSVKNDPTAWTYWDFVAGDFGYATSDMDYPDLAFSRTFLYASTDVFSANGRLVLRIPLEELAAGGTINYEYTDAAKSKNVWGGHLVQQTRSQAVWVGHQDNSTLEVFTMPDGGNTYSSFTVKVATWPNGSHSSTGPDGNDWLTKLRSFPNFAVTGGVERRNGRVVLAWSASKGKGTSNGFNFPNTHGRVVELDLGSRTVVSEMQIWNPDYAFAYPALAVNAKNEVGVILGWGGPSNHANCAMGIIGDFVVWYQNGSTRTVQRFGDYLTTRPAERKRSLFSGYGYYVTSVSGDASKCKYNPIYVRYGRASA
jgi:hypothetical protein